MRGAQHFCGEPAPLWVYLFLLYSPVLTRARGFERTQAGTLPKNMLLKLGQASQKWLVSNTLSEQLLIDFCYYVFYKYFWAHGPIEGLIGT